MEPSIPESIEAPSNVLLVHETSQPADACHDLCQSCSEVAELRISFAGAQTDCRPSPSANVGPEKLGIISVGDVLRSAEATTGPDYSAPFVVDAVDDPTDLSALGVTISEFCEQWGDAYQVRICFHSLDMLLRHAPPKRVFHFAYVLTKRLSSVDAIAHFHLDPTAHEDRIVSTFGSIFDEVVVDESVQADLPEATDEDVATMLSDWDETELWPAVASDGVVEEATDDDVARVLES